MRVNPPRAALYYLSISLLAASTPLLNGCSTAPSQADNTPNVATNASIEQANNLLSQGKKRAAAQTYFAASAAYPSPQRERIVLQAAELSASLGDATLTNRYLASLSGHLDGENQGRLAYVRALLALQQGDANAALRTLPQNLDALSPALREKVKHVQQQALTKGGKLSNTAVAQPTPQVQPALVPVSVNRVAALLPQTGPLGSVGREIYRGIEAARNALAPEITVQLYDVSSGNTVGQYQRAVADGADMVIGPLDKDALAQLLAQPQILSKPILSLNYLSNNRFIPGALYQFGLLPEDEARQVAEFASVRGQRTAILMTPDSNWGDRVGTAFRAAYQERGGQVINIQQYPDTPSDAYLQHVQSALAATQGRASMVFLAGSPSQARLLRPLLAA
ncbi:MAG: penicillin-binding protein activator, partial [Thiothrix sp.]